MNLHRTSSTAVGRRSRLALAVGVVAAVLATAAAPASAVNVDLGSRVVSDDPANWTPQVMDGSVKGITQVGSKMVAVGNFSRVRQTIDGPDIVRNGAFAFDATTGVIDPGFNPNLGNGGANSVDTDGTHVYVGGSFGSVSGVTSTRRVAKLTAAGTLVAGLRMPNSAVNEVVVRGNRLFIGGSFTSVAGTPRAGLAALDTGSGAVLPDVDVPFTGTYNGGSTSITRMDIDPAGTKLVAVGNFVTVGGEPREQIAVVDTPAGAAATVSSWSTDRFSQARNDCASVFNTFMRDVDVSPDGSFFAVNTTGAFAGGANSGTLCDTATRWEMSTGAGQQPTWTNYSGGDTLYGVAIAGDVVYIGGHFRWLNNAFAGDAVGPGAVPREGIAALDTLNGMPLSWNPGRTRGVGAEALYTTTQGLWVGSDTERIGGERRQRVAFLPLAGGSTLPVVAAPTLPGDLFLAERTSAANSGVLHRINAGGGPVLSGDGGPDWSGNTFVQGGNDAAWATGVTLDETVPAGTPAALFETEHWGGHSWNLPVTTGRQVQVRLYFANQYDGTASPGQRVFDVRVDGALVLDDFDIVAAVGNRRGTMRQFTVTSDGTIDIGFSNVVENPLVNAIEVVDPSVGGGATEGALLRRPVSGTGAPTGPATTASTAIDWTTVRGATVIGGTLYYGLTDGNLYARSFDPATAAVGAQRMVDLYDHPVDGRRIPFAIANLTGMAFDADTHRLYYTVAGQSGLYYRYFTPENEVVGAQTFTVPSPVNLSSAAGIVLAGGQMLYGSTIDGFLRSLPFTAGGPTGTATVLDTDSTWRYRSMFAGPASGPQNQAPTASFTSACTGLSCTFTSTSTDGDGIVAGASWQFGDGGTETGTPATHTYGSAGTRVVTLTVTDDDGAQDSTTASVTVSAQNQPPTAAFGTSCTQLECTFTSSSSDSDGSVVSTTWNFGDGGTDTGTQVEHTYATAGTRTVTVTVTDDDGAQSSASAQVSVSSTPVGEVTFVGAGTATGNAVQARVVLPGATQPGDRLLILLTLNRGDSVPSAPTAGGAWTPLLDRTGDQGQVRMLAWSRAAVADDANRAVAVPVSVKAKFVITATAHRGAVVATSVASAETVNRATHTTPTATADVAGSVVLSYWADKSASSTGWTAPAGTVDRAEVVGAGAGRVASLLAEQGPVGPGPVGGLTATSSTTSLKAVMATIVLRPA